jgi:hypothetical protein
MNTKQFCLVKSAAISEGCRYIFRLNVFFMQKIKQASSFKKLGKFLSDYAALHPMRHHIYYKSNLHSQKFKCVPGTFTFSNPYHSNKNKKTLKPKLLYMFFRVVLNFVSCHKERIWIYCVWEHRIICQKAKVRGWKKLHIVELRNL